MKSAFNLNHWDTVETFVDEEQRVTKFVFTKPDAVVETVLYRYPTYTERTVICHSVMSGCPMGCRFCGTGDFFVRNLTSDEMIEQVEYALWYALKDISTDGFFEDKFNDQIDKLQIMSMSMGEPMLNKNLDSAYRYLHQWYPNAALLMSTAAPDVAYEWFFKLAEDVPTVGMQFSVHESTDEARNKLIPFEKKLTLRQIGDKGHEFLSRTGRKPFFNYCAGPNNSTEADGRRLRTYFHPELWEATVSVICEQDPSGLVKSNEAQRQLAASFSEQLVYLGFNVRVFDPAGQDTIGGGCGQLWYVQEWAKNNPKLAKPSCGKAKAKVNIPIVVKNDSIWDTVKRTSTNITKPRTDMQIAAYAVTELGELMEEIIINQGEHSVKQPGKDGVVGEAVDVIICMLDLINRHAPQLTEVDIDAIVKQKCKKWENNVISSALERLRINPEDVKGWSDHE